MRDRREVRTWAVRFGVCGVVTALLCVAGATAEFPYAILALPYVTAAGCLLTLASGAMLVQALLRRPPRKVHRRIADVFE